VQLPENMTITGASEPLEILAADGEGKGVPKFSMVAYTGAEMNVGFSSPVVVDISGVKASQTVPILYEHGSREIVGHSTSVDLSAQRIKVNGHVSGVSQAATEVVATAKNGFPWQASIGLKISKAEHVEAGQTVKVNGRNFTGPITVIRAGTLREVSFVSMGADGNTSSSIAATLKGKTMDDVTKVKAPEVVAETKIEAADVISDIRKQAAAEAKRIADVRATCDGFDAIAATAIAEGWSADKAKATVLEAKLEKVRSERPTAPTGSGNKASESASAEVLQCAMEQTFKFEGHEKRYSDKVMQAAHTAYRGRLGLKQLLHAAAVNGGYNGDPYFASSSEATRDVLRAAFSTVGLSGILSNTANKSLLEGYMSVEGGWEAIAAKSTVSDFKTVTRYRMTGAHQFEELPAAGKIKHGTVDELSYTNQAKTYATMMAITRQMIINDDLSALSAIPRKIGRGAKLKLNDVFWTAFMDNSTFFASGNSNYFTGAATNLQSSSLATALLTFRDQTDADGKPLGVEPKTLLVPTNLEITGRELLESTGINTGGSSTSDKVPNKNIWAGSFDLVVSSYLKNTTYTGNSTKAWYLLADPMDLPVIEVCYLNGVETPTIETSDADFDQLGIQMRGYWDFGVAKQDPRGGVKSKGEA
jgi:hypothetical protein